MKYLIFISLLTSIILFPECTHPNDVRFETVKIVKHGNELSSDTTIRYLAELITLNPVSGPENLQTGIRQATNKWLKGLFPNQSSTSQNIGELADADMAAFVKKVQQETTPDEITTRIFELYVKPDSLQYQNDKVLSLPYNFYSYQGGAHGMKGMYCINFEKENAEEITYNKLVSNETGLLAVAEKHFREQRKIGKDEPLGEKYFFENGKFILSKAFAFKADGLHFFYQPYEIAPYSEGIIDLSLPYKDIREYIRY